MLLRSDEGDSLVIDESPTPNAEGIALQHDVERLIETAGQLFTAIERQIHYIEESLMLVQEEDDALRAQTVLKERLIRSAVGLKDTFHEIAVRLEEPTGRPATLERSRNLYAD
jgi:hypothetical protein